MLLLPETELSMGLLLYEFAWSYASVCFQAKEEKLSMANAAAFPEDCPALDGCPCRTPPENGSVGIVQIR